MSFKTTEEIEKMEEEMERRMAATPNHRPVFESIYSDFMKKQANLPGEVRTPLSTNSHMSCMRNELLLESKGHSYLTRQVNILNGFRCGIQIDFDEMSVYHLIITHPTDKQKKLILIVLLKMNMSLWFASL